MALHILQPDIRAVVHFQRFLLDSSRSFLLSSVVSVGPRTIEYVLLVIGTKACT